MLTRRGYAFISHLWSGDRDRAKGSLDGLPGDGKITLFFAKCPEFMIGCSAVNMTGTETKCDGLWNVLIVRRNLNMDDMDM